MRGEFHKLSRRAFVFSAAALLRAQQDTTFSAGVKVISVLATVRNKQGQIVQDLTKEEFLLEEDGRPQTIRYFSKETDLPLTLGLLVDTSGSQRRLLGAERDASFKFIEQVLREDKDQTFLIHFDREVELLQDLTSSRKKLEDALRDIDSPQQGQFGRRPQPGQYPRGRGGRGGGGTLLYDAVLLASDELMKKQKGRKALILLSDGVDHGSKLSLDSAIEAAQRADTMAYSVLFADKEEYGGGPQRGGGRGRRGGMGMPPPQGRTGAEGDGKRTLQRLAKETGGGFFEVSNKLPLDKVFARIEEELRNQYSLGYSSDKNDTGTAFRAIRVTTKRKGLIVQAREGYYPDAEANRSNR